MRVRSPHPQCHSRDRPPCVTEATTLTFNGSQHLWVSAGSAARSQAEDVALRFRTKFPVGLLMATSSDQTADRLDLVLSGGRVRATVHLGDKEKVSVEVVEVGGGRSCGALGQAFFLAS